LPTINSTELQNKPPASAPTRGWLLLVLVLLFLVVACGGDDRDPTPTTVREEQPVEPAEDKGAPTPTPTGVPVDLTLSEEDVTIDSLPVRAGFPFTVTAVIHNNGPQEAQDVPIMVYLSANQEEIGFTPFIQIMTVTIPATGTLPLAVPVDWNLDGGEHSLWIEVNRLPEAWQPHAPTQPEEEIADNIALLDLMIDPFDAYVSDLCPGRVDVEIAPADVVPEPALQRVSVRVHNVGNRALYNLPVVVLGGQTTGIAYTPPIPPCGGTAQVYVSMEHPFGEGDSLSVQVNPREWTDGLEEDDFDNNLVTISAGLAPGVEVPPGGGLEDYDFGITSADIGTPELWIVMVTVRNEGTRDAATVPILIENEAGRRLTDAIPLVRGKGTGVAAVRVGYLWTHGGTLTFTINPEDAKGAYPETNRDNNVATFTLP
jgi:hypothetical protein